MEKISFVRYAMPLCFVENPLIAVYSSWKSLCYLGVAGDILGVKGWNVWSCFCYIWMVDPFRRTDIFLQTVKVDHVMSKVLHRWMSIFLTWWLIVDLRNYCIPLWGLSKASTRFLFLSCACLSNVCSALSQVGLGLPMCSCSLAARCASWMGLLFLANYFLGLSQACLQSTS